MTKPIKWKSFDLFYLSWIIQFHLINAVSDIINIYRRDRNFCAEFSVYYLSDNGVIIFDNADLERYKDGVTFLLGKEFKKIDFWGVSPVTAHATCTTIFYKQNNVLNI